PGAPMTSASTTQAAGAGSAPVSPVGHATVTPPASSMSLPARALGVLFSPRATYADVASRPRWFGMFTLVLVFGIAATWIFLSTSVGQQASLDNQIRQMESFGRPVTDAQYARMEQMAPYSKYFAAGFQLVFTPV